MSYDVLNDPNCNPRVLLSEPGGSSAEVLLYGAQVVSWKNECGEELLYMSSKAIDKSRKSRRGGISICFPRLGNLGSFEQHEYAKYSLWSLDNGLLNLTPKGRRSSVDLVLKPTERDTKPWPCSLELKLRISLSLGKLTLTPSVRNSGNKSISFTFAVSNYLSISEISEVRIEGLETLDHIDNLQGKARFTEQADAITFDSEVNRVYLSTPPKIAIIDHGKKRTFVLRKEGLPDAGVKNPWDRTSKALPYFGDEDYKRMLCVDSVIFEKPVVLKPFQVWKGCQELSTVSSSYCSGQLDPRKVLQAISEYKPPNSYIGGSV